MMEDNIERLRQSTDPEPWSGERERQKMQMESYLSWNLEVGVIRGFLDELGAFADAFGRVKKSDEVVNLEEPRQMIMDRIRSKAKALKSRFRIHRRMKAIPEPERSSLLFGEIASDDNEKSEVSAQAAACDNLSGGLLWYHGRTGVSGFPPPEPEESSLGEVSQPAIERRKLRACFNIMAKKASGTGRKFKEALGRSWNCGNGSFESLD